MNDKSHVSMERHLCLVCGSAYDTGAILLDRQLRASMERHTVTGWGLCPEHEKFAREGFVALVECDPDRSGPVNADGTVNPDTVFRTGVITYLKREAFLDLFTVPTRELMRPCVFVDPSVTRLLKSHVAAAST